MVCFGACLLLRLGVSVCEEEVCVCVCFVCDFLRAAVWFVCVVVICLCDCVFVCVFACVCLCLCAPWNKNVLVCCVCGLLCGVAQCVYVFSLVRLSVCVFACVV